MSAAKFIASKQTQIISTAVAALSIISDAMQVSWSSPATPKLMAPDSPIKDFNEDSASWVELLYLIGSLIGLPITVLLVDKLGRKPSIMIASFTNLISWSLIALATNTTVLFTSRFIGGISSAINFIAVSIYIAEIADKRVRGFLSSFNSFSGVLGIIAIYSIAPFVSITTSALVAASINIFQLFAFLFIPESPYYLLKRKSYEKSKKALMFLRHRHQKIDEEFDEIKQAVERQEKEKSRFVDLFVNKGNRKATIIGCILYIAEHFGCVTIILMNLQTILEDAEGSIPAEIASILFALVTLVSAIIGMSLVDRVGRKRLLAISTITTALFLSLMATYFVLKDSNVDVSRFNWVPIVCIILYGLCVKGGLEMVPIIIIAEIFPTNIKAMGLTLADTVYVSFGLLTLYVYQILEKQFGIFYPFYLYAVVCGLISVFVMLYVPETKGKTLEEIQMELHGIPIKQIPQTENNKNATTSS